MCRACVSQLYLRDELFANGSAGLFGTTEVRTTRRDFMALSATAAAVASTLGSSRSAFAADGGADTIFINGTVIPVPGVTPVNALAIGQGKVLATGSKNVVMGLKTAQTKIVDLEGRTLLPGLMDSHHHTVMAGLVFELLHDVGYSVFPTRRQLIDGLRAIAARTPPG